MPCTRSAPALAVKSGTQCSRRFHCRPVSGRSAPQRTNGSITGAGPPRNSTSPLAPMCRQEKLPIAAVRSSSVGMETYSLPVGR